MRRSVEDGAVYVPGISARLTFKRSNRNTLAMPMRPKCSGFDSSVVPREPHQPSCLEVVRPLRCNSGDKAREGASQLKSRTDHRQST